MIYQLFGQRAVLLSTASVGRVKRDGLTKGWALPQLCIYLDNGLEEKPAQLALHPSQYESADPVALVVHRHQNLVT
jgi:hypothetical protein